MTYTSFTLCGSNLGLFLIPTQGGDFAWSPEFEALILNSFNIGFFFTPIIGGQIATAVGGKRVIAVSLLAGSVVTILLPPAAKLNEILVVVLRILAGMFLVSPRTFVNFSFNSARNCATPGYRLP